MKSRRKHYASLALTLALAHASFGQVRYKSVGNGMADITLELEDDQKFVLDFKPTTLDKHRTLKGTWTVENGKFVLNFKRRSRTDLTDFFASNTGFNKVYEVQENSVKFPAGIGGLMIWGIYCPREESEQTQS